MVMAQHPPNTQFVAHEFVRQYYTMLHKDPTQLHRFYTRESRLTHGVSPNAKSEDPVCGQEAIFEKISQLNFRNCYAKIRSVDSHPTIGGGVVIQVTGELSNGGMAMRKFMQTFVLAQQDVKRYNVFNDIFRYQDETFEDTEIDETADGTVESENCYSNGNHEPASANQVTPMDDVDQEVVSDDNIEPVPMVSNDTYQQYNNYREPSPLEDEVQDKDGDSVYENEDEVAEPIEPTVDEVPENIGGDYYHQVEVAAEPVDTEIPSDSVESAEDDGTEFKEYYDIKDEEPVEQTEQVQSEPEVEEPPKAFSWAALAKKNVPATATPATPAVVKPPAPKKVSPSQPPKTAPPPKKRSEPPIKRDSSDESRPPVRRGPLPDNHQVFIGNLPMGVTEEEIREAFDEFGTIVEVRLNPKNFGFIAYTGPEAPTQILTKTKTIIIRNNTINTEVKRSVGGGGRGGGGGFRGGGGRGRGGGRGGQNNQQRNTGYVQKQFRNPDENPNRIDKNNRDQKAPREQKAKR